MRETYVSKNFRSDSLKLLYLAQRIVREYMGQGYTLTLRQLYYQFVARDIIENSERSYKRLGGLINDGRLAGYIDWEAIEDRTREVSILSHWNHPSDIVRACAEQFALDKWREQPNYVEVWVEKEALAGVIEPVCEEFDVPFFSCRGYPSQSSVWRAGQRMKHVNGEPHILHLGDHDPSGIDMTRDIEDRIYLFAQRPVVVRRLALNMDQIEEFKPPPNPAKLTDSRALDYVRQYGRSSWELDALEPKILTDLVAEEVMRLRDDTLWDEEVSREERYRSKLRDIAANL